MDNYSNEEEKAPAPEGAEANPLPREEGGMGQRRETHDEAARRQMSAVLVKILFNLSRDFQEAAYKVGKR